jgi:hypothetical protein
MLRALTVTLMLAAASPAVFAADPPAPDRSPGALIDEVLQDALDAIGLLMRAVPQYELPEVLPNGDIIIRRVQPEGPPAVPPAGPDPGGDGVRT